MRWSTFRTADGDEQVGLWDADQLRPVPGRSSLLELIARERLATAAEEAADQPALDPGSVELLAPIPRPPSIRDFMAFEEHVVTASAAIGARRRPALVPAAVLLLHQPRLAARRARPTSRSPPAVAAFDYELEIAVVLGREGRDLTPGRGRRPHRRLRPLLRLERP